MNYIITSRPEGMSYDAYKELKNQQKKALKNYKNRIPIASIKNNSDKK